MDNIASVSRLMLLPHESSEYGRFLTVLASPNREFPLKRFSQKQKVILRKKLHRVIIITKGYQHAKVERIRLFRLVPRIEVL